MDKNIILSACKSSAGKLLFYIFEIAALVIGVISLVIAIYSSATTASFLVFVSGLVSAVINTLVIYGIGKIIDLLYLKSESTKVEEKETIVKDENETE